ncbi:MAG: glycoside hydrolase family 26 [Acidobacteria bacterium]|nr:glycoside hydrolase family 26 [Acidobacteriota bacterium]
MRMEFFRYLILAVLILCVAGPLAAQEASKASGSDASKFVYADFQNLQNGRPVSKRGGVTRLNRYSQNPANPPQYRGLENAEPPAPAAARVTADDIAAAFDYELRIPNEWEGVNIEIFGEPEKEGKLVADDVSAYKYITLRAFAKGAQFIRIELITRGQGANLESGYPFANIRVGPGFNTYKLKLDTFTQPQWAMPLDLKSDVLKKLTSISVGVFCDKCTLEKGTVVIDNIAFEK